MFALYMFEKMSKAIWSKKLLEEQNNKNTSQMDREVAAGWFDEMLLDRNFKFRDFTRNVPQSHDSLPLSQHSSQFPGTSYMSLSMR